MEVKVVLPQDLQICEEDEEATPASEIAGMLFQYHALDLNNRDPAQPVSFVELLMEGEDGWDLGHDVWQLGSQTEYSLPPPVSTLGSSSGAVDAHAVIAAHRAAQAAAAVSRPQGMGNNI